MKFIYCVNTIKIHHKLAMSNKSVSEMSRSIDNTLQSINILLCDIVDSNNASFKVISKNITNLSKDVSDLKNSVSNFTQFINDNSSQNHNLDNSSYFSGKMNNKIIREAVALYFSNKEECDKRFGHFSNWNVSEVTDFSHLFENRFEFTEILNWDVSKGKTFVRMFFGCYRMNKRQKWTIPNNADVSEMYDETFVNQCFCDSIFRYAIDLYRTNPDLCFEIYGNISHWDVSNVVDMSHAFQEHKTFNVPLYWNPINVVTADRMFYMCESLNQNFDWVMPKLKSMIQMFERCISLNKKIIIKASDVLYIDRAFRFCASLNSQVSIICPAAISAKELFLGCSNLNCEPDIDSCMLKNIQGIMSNCVSYNQYFALNTKRVIDMSEAFRNCEQMQHYIFWIVQNNCDTSMIFNGAHEFLSKHKDIRDMQNDDNYLRMHDNNVLM